MDNSYKSTSYIILWIFLIILFLWGLNHWNTGEDLDVVELSELEEATQPEEIPSPVWHRPYVSVQIPQRTGPTDTEPSQPIKQPYITPSDLDDDANLDYVAYVDESTDADIGGEIMRTEDEPEIPGTSPPTPPCQFQEC